MYIRIYIYIYTYIYIYIYIYPPDSCRRTSCLCSGGVQCVLPPGEILKSGVGISFGLPGKMFTSLLQF